MIEVWTLLAKHGIQSLVSIWPEALGTSWRKYQSLAGLEGRDVACVHGRAMNQIFCTVTDAVRGTRVSCWNSRLLSLCSEDSGTWVQLASTISQVSVLFLLKLKFRRYQSSEKLSLCRENTWKLTAAQRSFRDWCSGGQETRSALATHASGSLLWRAAADNSKNWSPLKSAPPGHCHMSDGAQTTRTFFFVEGTHVHWQATAEHFFFS